MLFNKEWNKLIFFYYGGLSDIFHVVASGSAAKSYYTAAGLSDIFQVIATLQRCQM